jgi:hypothetical protein
MLAKKKLTEECRMIRVNFVMEQNLEGSLSRPSNWIRFALSMVITIAHGTVASAGERPVGWAQVLSNSVPIRVNAVPVTLPSGDMSGLVLAGTWELTSDHPDFGGLSALLIDAGKLYAVTDSGRWFSASLDLENGALCLEDAALAPMHNMDGEIYDDKTGDAEGITWLGHRLAVLFERDDRIIVLEESGRLVEFVRFDVLEGFPPNMRFEALATLDDGRLIALAESSDERGTPVLVVGPDVTVHEGRLLPAEPHVASGAHIGPDGNLYLLLRSTNHFVGYSFRGLLGSSIRIERYRVGADGFPIADTAETLATFEGDSGIDRMEGIALERDPEGKMYL